VLDPAAVETDVPQHEVVEPCEALNGAAGAVLGDGRVGDAATPARRRAGQVLLPVRGSIL
jgi:hypothetical protein